VTKITTSFQEATGASAYLGGKKSLPRKAFGGRKVKKIQNLPGGTGIVNSWRGAPTGRATKKKRSHRSKCLAPKTFNEQR